MPAQSVMETGQHALLQDRVEVDEHVPADEEIEARNRGVADEVVDAEDDGAPKLFPHRVAAAFLDEPLGQQSLRDGLHLLARVMAPARIRDRPLVDVGAEDANLLGGERRTHRVGEDHRGRERLLTRRTSRAPDADLFALRLLRKHPRDRLRRQLLPDLGVAEKGRDLDQHPADERVELAGIAVEQGGVFPHRALAALLHAPLDAPEQRAAFVIAKVEVT